MTDDWTLELYIAGAPSVLTMVFRSKASATTAKNAIALAVDGGGTTPKGGWLDDDGAHVFFEARHLVAARLAPWNARRC